MLVRAGAGASGEGVDDSPDPAGRKLFESPDGEGGHLHFDGAVGGGDDEDVFEGAVASDREDEDEEDAEGVGLEADDQADACRMLVNGEIAADTFDVEAFLPVAAAAMGSLSEMSSVRALRPRPADPSRAS